MSRPLIANMILFVDISNFSSERLFTFSHIGILEKIVCVLICNDNIFLSILMAGVMCSHYSKQEEDILEHTK